MIPHFPLLEVSVNPLPLAAAVIFPGVCVLQVPEERIPPVLVPDTKTEIVPDEGTPVGVPPPEVVVGVPPPLPDFGRYLIPLDGQLPGVVASILINEPSMMDPLTYGQDRTRVRGIDRTDHAKIDTHVVIIIDLKESARVTLKADREAIRGRSLECIHDILTGVCLCTRRSDSTCSEPVERWELLVEVHSRGKVRNGSLLSVGDAIGTECAIGGSVKYMTNGK